MVTGESYLNGTITATTQLDLSFDKVVDRPPHQPLERDLVISEQELRNFAEDIWSEQSLLVSHLSPSEVTGWKGSCFGRQGLSFSALISQVLIFCVLFSLSLVIHFK